MATIQKQGKGYKITVSQGYDYSGKRIRQYMTWIPEPSMTERQIKKELERRAVLFEEQVKTGATANANIRFADFAAKYMAEYAQLYTETMLISSSTRNMAEAAAQQIYLLREYRLDLLTGNSDEIPQGQSFEILLREMDKREALLTSLFLGTVESETLVEDIVIDPENKNSVAFRFSERKGILPADDLSGEPIYVSTEVKEVIEAPTDSKGKVIAPASNALVYITPGKADVTVSYTGETLCQKEIPMAQLGAAYGIDPSVFNGSGAVEATFCPESGALLHIGIADEKPIK